MHKTGDLSRIKMVHCRQFQTYVSLFTVLGREDSHLKAGICSVRKRLRVINYINLGGI